MLLFIGVPPGNLVLAAAYQHSASFLSSSVIACADKDAGFLQNLPRNKLHAGSSEILNSVGGAGACEHLDLNWFEYVPGYRTPAGTGTGLSFASWA
jgi:hypothetical protein